MERLAGDEPDRAAEARLAAVRAQGRIAVAQDAAGRAAARLQAVARGHHARDALRGVPETQDQLLLAHCPQYRDALPDASAPGWFQPAHMLSGHTHGGQVTLFGIPLFLPRGSGRYLKGWYHDQDGTLPALYVSRGLGMSGLPIRFWAAPELSLFELPIGQRSAMDDFVAPPLHARG